MKQIIDEFYDIIIKPNEDYLEPHIKKVKYRYIPVIGGYIFAIFIMCFALVIPAQGGGLDLSNPGYLTYAIVLLIIGIIVTIIFIIYLLRIRSVTSKDIPLKRRLLRYVHINANSSIDTCHSFEAVFCYFAELFIVIFLYLWITSNPELILVLGIISIFILVTYTIIVYKAFLAKRTKLTKKGLLIKKFITGKKIMMKWSDMKLCEVRQIRHHSSDSNEGGGNTYYTYHLLLYTKLREERFKIYLGRSKKVFLLQILKWFFMYMKEFSETGDSLQLQEELKNFGSSIPLSFRSTLSPLSQHVQIPPQVTVIAEPAAMSCDSCGEEIPEGFIFCEKCGTKLDIEEQKGGEISFNKENKNFLITITQIPDNIEDFLNNFEEKFLSNKHRYEGKKFKLNTVNSKEIEKNELDSTLHEVSFNFKGSGKITLHIPVYFIISKKNSKMEVYFQAEFGGEGRMSMLVVNTMVNTGMFGPHLFRTLLINAINDSL